MTKSVRILALSIALILNGALSCMTAQAVERAAWTTSRIQGSPDPPSPYRTELAFPNQKFDEPVALTAVPGSNRLVVVQRFGKIFTFENNRESSERRLLLDVQAALDVERVEVFGIAFHPNFEQNGRFFLHHHRPEEKLPTRVSSFRVKKDDPLSADPASETMVIRWPNGHNGGTVKFGRDGYLYISNGDQGGLHDPDEVGQGIADLQASILRIDVDGTSGDLAYRIPPDNPFVDIPEARHEVWAYGLRNPWRFSFDRKTGELWAADVGEDLWESVHKVERGGNYGWSVEEGGYPFRPARKRGPTPIQKPIVAHEHSESRSITGGYVYRGKKLNELIGHYVYGDYDTGILWMLGYDGKEITAHREICDSNLRLVGFGEDAAGELYLVDHIGGGIHQLVPNEQVDTSADFPRRLSDTGLFASTKELTPAAGLIPYDVIAPQWCDGATKQRYMALPDSSQIEFEAVCFPFRGGRDGWKFPDGAVLMETLFLEMEAGNANSRRRIETRILHHERLIGPEDVGDQLWRGYSYIWNEAQTDADLLENPRGLERRFTIRDDKWPGGQRQQTWRFPARTECSACHNMAAKYVLGCQTLQTNRAKESNDSINQLDHFQSMKVFTAPLPKRPAELPALTDYRDESQPLEGRARSYLHANCSHCHRNGGGGNSDFFALASFEMDQLKILNAPPNHGAFHIPGAKIVASGRPLQSVLYYRMSSLGGGRMPRIGSRVVDREGLDLMRRWISGAQPSKDPKIDLTATSFSTTEALQLTQLIDAGLDPVVRAKVIERGLQGEPHIRDLFERFIPEEQRTKRLGNSIDPQTILSLTGDPARGKRIFFDQSGMQCKSCHRVGDRGENIGPSLDGIGKRMNPAQILASILQPSQQIDAAYLLYQCITVDGKTYSGLIVERTDEFVILRDAKAKTIKIAAEEIEVLAAQSQSMMPELLVKDLTAQQAADLTAFLDSLE